MPTPNLAPIKNLTPREQFRESVDNISKHRNLVDLPEFTRATFFALLEYQRLVATQVRDGNSSMAAGFKIQGAIEIMGVLKTLAETPTLPPSQVETQSLDHRA